MEKFVRIEYVIHDSLEWYNTDIEGTNQTWQELRDSIVKEPEKALMDNLYDCNVKDLLYELLLKRIVEGYYEDDKEVITKTTVLNKKLLG